MLALSPNKQTILFLKKQLKLVNNGHKLLKEKLVGLTNIFTDLVNQGYLLEKQLDENLDLVFKKFQKVNLFIDKEQITEFLKNNPKTLVNLEIRHKKILGVFLQQINLQVNPGLYTDLKIEIQTCLQEFSLLFPLILKLSELKTNCQKLSQEIKKTLRQISNLEKKQQNLKNQIKYIKSYLAEQENLNRATLIKIFKN